MSFLLRNDIGRRKPLANRPSGQFPALRQSAANFVRRDAGGSSGERQSMVQIHRPPANTVQVQQAQSQSLTMKEGACLTLQFIVKRSIFLTQSFPFFQ